MIEGKRKFIIDICTGVIGVVGGVLFLMSAGRQHLLNSIHNHSEEGSPDVWQDENGLLIEYKTECIGD